MKLLIDMNLSPRWATWLSAAGIFATHWSSVGAANAEDSEIMAYAAANGYTVSPMISISVQSLPLHMAKSLVLCKSGLRNCVLRLSGNM